MLWGCFRIRPSEAVVFSFDEKTHARRWTGPSRRCR